MKLHHAAVCVTDIPKACDWYANTLGATVSYQDETWALLKLDNTSLALVIPSQHPPHLAFENDQADKFGPLTPHRDGTASVYVEDPFGNIIEFLKVPVPATAA